MNIAIVGCGLIGKKRSESLAGARLVVCADSNLAKADKLAQGTGGCVATQDWRQAVTQENVSAVVIATQTESAP